MSVGNLGCAVTISACAMFLVVGYAVQHTWEQRRLDEQVAMATPVPEKAKPKVDEPPVPPTPETRSIPPEPMPVEAPDFPEIATPRASRDDPPEFGFLSVDIKQQNADDAASLYTFDRRVRVGEDRLVCSIELPKIVTPAVFHVRYPEDAEKPLVEKPLVEKPFVERFEMKLDALVDAKVKYNRWKWESAVATADTAAKPDTGRSTHVYFVCAGDANAPTLETVRELVVIGVKRPPGGDWVVRFDGRKAEFWGASSGQLPQPPTAAGAELEALRSRLDRFSKRLAERYKYVSGVVFPAE